MEAQLKEVLYTAEAVVEGGREGHGRTSDGRLVVDFSLDLHAPNIAADEARELMLGADPRCPYSNATRGNITVALSVDGQRVAQAG